MVHLPFYSRSHWGRWLVVVWLFVGMLSLNSAIAQTTKAPLPLTGQIMDNAGMISAAVEARLLSKLAAHETKSGNQIVVLTIPSLNGENLEDYSLRLGRGWKLGQKDLNNGVLFLVAKADRKMRIEVGYGLEGTLTDAIASLIIRETITPFFKQGNFDLGIEKGADQIVTVLESDEAALQAWRERAESQSYDEDKDGWIIFFIFGCWFFIFFSSWITGWLTKKFGREIKPGHYRWLGMDAGPNAPKPKRSGSGSHRGGWGGSSGGGGFSGGGGGFGGGGSSGGW